MAKNKKIKDYFGLKQEKLTGQVKSPPSFSIRTFRKLILNDSSRKIEGKLQEFLRSGKNFYHIVVYSVKWEIASPPQHALIYPAKLLISV